VAPGFLEATTEASIQTREEIQEESEVKVCKASMDEGCEAYAAWQHRFRGCLWRSVLGLEYGYLGTRRATVCGSSQMVLGYDGIDMDKGPSST